jgi:predicted HAD superfamily Cof-like phosphohydrolase
MSINVFEDQKIFMEAGDQTTDRFNKEQLELYINLIREEVAEMEDAINASNNVELLDAFLDIAVVTIGAIHSLGIDAQGSWDEVTRSNFSKVDKASGKLLKLPNGKISKPDTFSPVNLDQFFVN